jgi:hypothetical protein
MYHIYIKVTIIWTYAVYKKKSIQQLSIPWAQALVSVADTLATVRPPPSSPLGGRGAHGCWPYPNAWPGDFVVDWRLEKSTAVLIVLQILQMSTKACQICRCQPNPIPSIPHFGPGWAHTFPSTMTTSTTAETPINSPVRSTKYSPGAKKLTKLLNLTRFQQRPVNHGR